MNKNLAFALAALIFILAIQLTLTLLQINVAEELKEEAENPSKPNTLQALWTEKSFIFTLSLKRSQIEKCKREIELLSYYSQNENAKEYSLQKFRTLQALEEIKENLIPKIF